YIEKIDTENGPNTTEAIEKLLKPEGHLALTIKNINNVLGRLDDEDLQELAQDQREWLDDLTSSVEGEDITPDEALSQIRDKMPEIEDVYKRAGEKVQRLRREVQEKGEERERSERQEGFRRQQVWSIVDIAEG